MSVRIGTGAGYSGSRVEPAIEIAERGSVKYLVFECLGERTVAIAQTIRSSGRGPGYDPYLEWRMPRVLRACIPAGVRIITNMGGANPGAAARKIADLARDVGLGEVPIAVIHGDDVLTMAKSADLTLDIGLTVRDLGSRLVSASAYIGAGPIVEALDRGAEIVIGGRIADPSLYLGPLCFEFGWGDRDWRSLGAGTAVGHLLECSAQVTGGYFADPGYCDVEGLATIGFPIADVDSSGSATITKVEGSGGAVTVATCTQQLLYEVGDPSAYITPDVVADFSDVELVQGGADRVSVTGATGKARTDTLKVAVGYWDGFLGEGSISYGGPGAVARAQLAGDVLRRRFEIIGLSVRDLAVEIIGWDALYGRPLVDTEPGEVRFRVAGKTDTREEAEEIGHEVEALYGTGPAGGGGVGRSVKEVVAIASGLLPRELIKLEVEML